MLSHQDSTKNILNKDRIKMNNKATFTFLPSFTIFRNFENDKKVIYIISKNVSSLAYMQLCATGFLMLVP